MPKSDLTRVLWSFGFASIAWGQTAFAIDSINIDQFDSLPAESLPNGTIFHAISPFLFEKDTDTALASPGRAKHDDEGNLVVEPSKSAACMIELTGQPKTSRRIMPKTLAVTEVQLETSEIKAVTSNYLTLEPASTLYKYTFSFGEQPNAGDDNFEMLYCVSKGRPLTIGDIRKLVASRMTLSPPQLEGSVRLEQPKSSNSRAKPALDRGGKKATRSSGTSRAVRPK